MAWTLLPRPAPMTPEHWLNIATQGLAPAPAQRVRAEYLAHLEDAWGAGEGPAAVLRAWGDPHAVNRELRRAHLTTRETRYLPAGYAPNWSGLGRAVSEDGVVLGVFGYRAIPDAWRGEASPVALTLILGSVLLAGLRWWVLSRQVFPLTVRAGLHWLLSPLSVAALALAGLLIWTAANGEWSGWSGLFEPWWSGPLLLSYLAYHGSRLWTALRAAHKAAA